MSSQIEANRFSMNRRRRSSLDRELALLDTHLQTLRRRDIEFQSLLDSIGKMKEEVSSEMNALEEKKVDLEAQKEPINWLPTELLVQIFLALVNLEPGDPTYRPPVVISHVCAKWRSISLHTQALWSQIILQGFRQPEIAKTLLLRSGTAQLAVTYRSSHLILPTDECRHMINFVQTCEPNFKRVQQFTIKANTPTPLQYFLSATEDLLNTLPSLQRLELGIQADSPSFLEAPGLLISRGSSKTSTTPSTLRYLKLQQFPLSPFPSNFISSLRTLNLTLPPRKTPVGRHDYYLKISAFCAFLRSTPQLEELFLINTVPYFDVSLTPTTGSTGTDVAAQVELVELPRLEAIEWSYPFPKDVYRFLSFIDAPALEKLDIWIEDCPAGSRQTQTPLNSSSSTDRGIITYPCLRDLVIQCTNEDSITEALRRFSFPALETLAFANVDEVARRQATELHPLPTFPRLDYIFRDPRLPNLTHLTLSHFNIPQDPGKAEAVLGYMPVLTSLSLDSCSGVGRLMEVLQERLIVGTIVPPHSRVRAHAAPGLVVDGKAQHIRPMRGVRVCPKLESMSFWGCHDMTFQALRAVVLSRNQSTPQNDYEEGLSGSVQNRLQIPNGDGGRTQVVTRGLAARDGKGTANHEALEAQMGREIKPLRKLRCHGHGQTPSLAPSLISPGTSSLTLCNVMSRVTSAPTSSEPADIIFLRISNCRMIKEGQGMLFRDLGVVGVIWAGSS